MDQRDWKLLDKQMRRLRPPRNAGAVALTGAMAFFVGFALGGVLFAHESERRQPVSYQSTAATPLPNGAPSQMAQHPKVDRGPWY